MSTRRLSLILMFATFAPAAAAAADSPPLSAQKEGGINGDSRGAIRTLNESTPKQRESGTTTVVPNLGGEGRAPIRKVPDGTSGAGIAR